MHFSFCFLWQVSQGRDGDEKMLGSAHQPFLSSFLAFAPEDSLLSAHRAHHPTTCHPESMPPGCHCVVHPSGGPERLSLLVCVSCKSPAKWRCDGTLATDRVAHGLLMECVDGRPVLSTLAMSCSWSSLVKQTHYPHVGTLCQVAGFHQHESSSAAFLC